MRLGIGLNDLSARPPIEKSLLDPVVLGELYLVDPARFDRQRSSRDRPEGEHLRVVLAAFGLVHDGQPVAAGGHVLESEFGLSGGKLGSIGVEGVVLTR